MTTAPGTHHEDLAPLLSAAARWRLKVFFANWPPEVRFALQRSTPEELSVSAQGAEDSLNGGTQLHIPLRGEEGKLEQDVQTRINSENRRRDSYFTRAARSREKLALETERAAGAMLPYAPAPTRT